VSIIRQSQVGKIVAAVRELDEAREKHTPVSGEYKRAKAVVTRAKGNASDAERVRAAILIMRSRKYPIAP
jgi:hypothetical protein